jgi:hypothetical protein
VNLTPRPLYRRKKYSFFPLDKKLHGPQFRCGRYGARNYILLSTGNHTPAAYRVAHRITHSALPQIFYPMNIIQNDSVIYYLRTLCGPEQELNF